MWSEEKIVEYLEEHIPAARVKHILGVVKTSEELSNFYGADCKKARLSAYIHDAAKYTKGHEAISFLEQRGFILSEEDRAMPSLLHGLVGAVIGREVMGIDNDEVFDAARYHTTGRENMTLLEKIIFIADYIEPSRSFKGVEELRELAYKSLDSAILKAIDNTIKYVIDNGKPIHTATIKSRNYILNTMSQESFNEHNIR